jgi:large subunit ribosomal protein L10
MSRLIKEKMVEKYQTRFREVADAAVVSTKGLGVLQVTSLRTSLRAKGIRAMTVQNRICRRALEATALAPMATLLKGPSTVVWGSDGIVGLAKALTAELKALAKMEIRGGVTGGQVLSKTDMEALSKMPSREELFGRVAGQAMNPAGRVAAMLTASAAGVVSQIREIEKKAPPESAPAAEAAPAVAPEAPAAPAVPSA